jgi:hypothetical protein
VEYRELGRSGLKVSAYGLGVMTFGGQTPEDDAVRQMDMARDAGITLFDTAENYPIPNRAGDPGPVGGGSGPLDRIAGPARQGGRGRPRSQGPATLPAT